MSNKEEIKQALGVLTKKQLISLVVVLGSVTITLSGVIFKLRQESEKKFRQDIQQQLNTIDTTYTNGSTRMFHAVTTGFDGVRKDIKDLQTEQAKTHDILEEIKKSQPAQTKRVIDAISNSYDKGKQIKDEVYMPKSINDITLDIMRPDSALTPQDIKKKSMETL